MYSSLQINNRKRSPSSYFITFEDLLQYLFEYFVFFCASNEQALDKRLEGVVFYTAIIFNALGQTAVFLDVGGQAPDKPALDSVNEQIQLRELTERLFGYIRRAHGYLILGHNELGVKHPRRQIDLDPSATQAQKLSRGEE